MQFTAILLLGLFLAAVASARRSGRRHGGKNNNNNGDSPKENESILNGNLFDGTGIDSAVPTTVDELLGNVSIVVRSIIAQNRNIAPTFVRLGFHDCVGFGGCNGCVNIEGNIENRGLEPAINALVPVIAEVEKANLGVSRADLIAFTALIAADVSQNEIVGVNFLAGFNIGRVTCEAAAMCNGTPEFCYRNGPDQQSDFPSPDLTTHALTQYFDENFGFTADQTVVIMGAHTLGDANLGNSGFDGGNGWVRNERTLDNEYYRQIVGDDGDLANAPNWKQVRIDNSGRRDFPDRFQWVRNGGGGRGNNLRHLGRGRGGGNDGRGNGGNNGGGRGNGGRGNGGRGRNGGGRGNGGRGNGGRGNGGRGNGGRGRNGGGNRGGGGRLFMLNADISIVRNTTNFIEQNGRATCTFHLPEAAGCPLASTIGKAGQYREDNALFVTDFFAAFSQMLETGLETGLKE